MKDPGNNSRGFGFITFKDAESVAKVQRAHSEEPLCIDDKIIDPKPAVPRRSSRQRQQSSIVQVRRIFVGGLSSDTVEDDMREYFEQFGTVEEVQLMFDKNTNRHRGFGFVTFEKPTPAEKVCGIQYHDIKGKKVEVKVAQTKEALALQAGKTRVAYGQNYSNGYPCSPTYPSFYSQYPFDLYSPPMLIGGKQGGPAKHRTAGGSINHFSPPFYGNGYNFPGDHRMAGPPFFSSGFGGLPPPFFMRGMPGDPSSPYPLGSPGSIDYLSDHFQGLALMSNPYLSPTHGSPPNSYPPTMTATPTGYQNGYSLNNGGEMTYSPPRGISPKGTPTDGTPSNHTQVPSYSSQSSYPLQQPTV